MEMPIDRWRRQFRDPDPLFCLRCNESLHAYEAGESTCPKCGLQYDSEDARTFRTRPMFLRWRFWFPGLCLSIISGVLSYSICLLTGELGLALFIAVPISFGAILGYATRVQYSLTIVAGIIAIGSVVTALFYMHIAGLFCGVVLGVYFMIPTLFGMTLGFLLRSRLRTSNWNQRWFLPLVGFMLLPYAVQLVELNLPRRREVAVVQTALTVDATPEEAWNALMFYEQVEHQPPWLLRWSLPQPQRTEGNKTRAGEVVRCFYDRGHLAKRISRVEPGRLLAFEVVEQQLHFERDIKLRDGSFRLNRLGPARTQIMLTTRYERLLAPRFIWAPIERHVVHTLHGHVLEGMRRKAESESPKVDPPPYRPVPAKPYAPPANDLLVGRKPMNPVAGD